MKPSLFPKHLHHRARGFALVISLTLMVLLTVLAVGLLTLSTISLRATTQGEAMQMARANARMALTLAIGQLQKSAGPDQRISAPGNLLSPESHPGLTGIWESVKLSPDGNPELDQTRLSAQGDDAPNGEFVTWLASSSWAAASGDPATPPSASSDGRSATLLKPLSTAAGKLPLSMDLLPVSDEGGIAWASIDEGVKARFDLPSDPSGLAAESLKSRLRAPARTSPESLDGLSGLKLEAADAAKMASFRQGEFIAGDKEAFLTLNDALTPWSMSLPVNVADGGLKADLTRAFEPTALPSELAGRYLYSNLKTPLTPADPLFSNLAAYYQLHTLGAGGTRALNLAAPRNYRAVTYDARSRANTPNLASLDGNLIAPVVSKVQVAFSLVSREAHSHWLQTVPNTTSDPRRTFMVYLIYTPVVTLYNPYNTPLNVSGLKVTFKYLPLAFQFFRNGVAQNNSPALLSQFHVSSENRSDWEDQFTATLSNVAGSSSASLVLMPGEAKVFGVNHPKGTRWGSMTNYLWQNDLGSSKTLNLFAGPGWNFRSGFIVDWLRPAGAGRSSDNGTLGVFGARGDDRINVACTPKMPGGSNGQFSVDISARIGNRDTQIGSYLYRYGTESRLIEVMEDGSHPSLGKIEYPFRREKDWNLNELYQANIESTPVENWTGPKQFAIFTLADRTAQDSLFPGKPVIHSSFAHQVLRMDVSSTHPAQMPMELSFLPIRTEGANTVGSIEADPLDRTYFFAGNRLATGLLNFPSIQVPASPLVNIGSFRHAHLASSGHFPLSTYTVGESHASPLLPADKARVTTSSFGYPLSDHSWLANNSLWDGYYFSGLRDADLARDFFTDGVHPLNPRLSPLPVPGLSATAAADRALAAEAWISNASSQGIKGGFNVNSTSVDAWKAVLASLSGTTVPVLDPVTVEESQAGSADFPLPRTLRGLSGPITDPGTATNQNRWAGFRELDEQELDLLATEIVAQIRDHGPFRSMSEFVNRRLGPESDENSSAGVLELAIREAGINQGAGGPNPRLVSSADADKAGYTHKKAAIGDSSQGANAFLSQGDLLEALGASLTVRSDTFIIRAYGESTDNKGAILAKAVCEAVVQRFPTFVDPDDAADKVQAALGDDARSITALSEPNRRFGRRFEVVSLRWLGAEEI
jgi:Tfp pilus assembly protein PilX